MKIHSRGLSASAIFLLFLKWAVGFIVITRSSPQLLCKAVGVVTLYVLSDVEGLTNIVSKSEALSQQDKIIQSSLDLY